MVKVLLDKYPLGSIPNQQSAGRYMDELLKSNIDIFAKNIVNDMQFLGICSSSTFEVRTGKSTLLQQIGEYYTDSVNKMHNLNLTFDMNNIVFSVSKFIERAFELPKYSVLILDENDEVDEHFFAELSKSFRKFLKRAGQLNLLMLLVVPDFFQLKKGLAITRSNFLIDVKYFGEFKRGYFDFYGFEEKRTLFIKGKPNYDWKIINPNIKGGRFLEGYAVNKEEYLATKKIDLEESDNDVMKEKRPWFYTGLVKLNEKYTLDELGVMFLVDGKTIFEAIEVGRRIIMIEKKLNLHRKYGKYDDLMPGEE